MSGQKKPHLPIGYWVKKVDELLTSRINEVQEANGLSRTQWQILNFLNETSSAPRAQIVDVLNPFGDANTLGVTIDSLVERGLIEEEGPESGNLWLTAQGRALHATALEAQKKVRQQAVQGIAEADYVTAVRVLQQIVTNLTGEES